MRPNTRIALLRGINVGGHHVVKMAELRAGLEGLGAKAVRTYIQSGNVVFEGGPDADGIAGWIHAEYGFRPRVLVLSAQRLEAIASANPFPEPEANAGSVHIWFPTGPVDADVAALESLRAPTERYAVTEAAFYLHAPEGIGRSKLAASVEGVLGTEATARNGRTIGRLLALAADGTGTSLR